MSPYAAPDANLTIADFSSKWIPGLKGVFGTDQAALEIASHRRLGEMPTSA